MNSFRNFSRSALMAAAFVGSIAAVPTSSMAGVGLITPSDLHGNWVATLSGFTGCGQTALHVAINMNATGTGTATLTTHGQCGNTTVQGQTFRILTLDTNGTGTANLTCGPGCGWNLRVQVSPDRSVMNLAGVDRANPGNYLAGVAVHY